MKLQQIISYMLLFLNKYSNYFTLSWIKFIYKSKSMIQLELFVSMSPYLISEERWNIMKLRPSQRRPWANMLRNVNKCENGWSNFSASIRVVALKLTKLIWFSLPNKWFYSISYVPLHREWRHHVLSLYLRWACIYASLSLYTLGILASS